MTTHGGAHAKPFTQKASSTQFRSLARPYSDALTHYPSRLKRSRRLLVCRSLELSPILRLPVKWRKQSLVRRELRFRCWQTKLGIRLHPKLGPLLIKEESF